MSIFGAILSKIFHGSAAAATPASATPAGATPDATAAQPATPGAPATTPAEPVDVGAVLAALASAKGGGGNYQTSIVDLLKLLDLDSSLSARSELGKELSVTAGADGTAEQNVALHKAVVKKLEENGGKVPDSMKS